MKFNVECVHIYAFGKAFRALKKIGTHTKFYL